MINPKWSLKKIEKELVAWSNNAGNRSRMLDKPMEKLSSYTFGEPGIVASNLRWLFVWYLNSGTLDLLQGRDGWVDLGRASRYYCCRVGILNALFYRRELNDRSSMLSVNDAALSMALSLTLGLHDDARSTWRILMKDLATGFFDGESQSRLAPFMSRLLCDFNEVPCPPEIDDLADMEGYRLLLAHWRSRDVNEFREAVLTACDLHTYRSGNSTDNETFEFDWMAFRALPVEVLTVFRLRKLLGLLIPNIEHPLLSSPCGELPKEVESPVEDNPIERAIDSVRNELGISEVPS